MKTPITFCLALLLFPLCHAQCDLNVSESQLVSALSQASFISEADQSKFTLQDLTYLCFVRSSSDNTKFDQVRVSMLYTYDLVTDLSAQATFTLCLGTFRFNGANVNSVTQYPHLTENMTIEGCQDCLDNSTFASPTFCRLDDPCDAAPCANGSTCSRTGLTDYSCACDRNWGGASCNNSNGVILTSGAIIGIAVGCVIAAIVVAVLVGVAILIVFIVIRQKDKVDIDMNMQSKGMMPKQSG